MPIARIIGAGSTPMNPKPPRTAIQYMLDALHAALQDANIDLDRLDGLVAVPSLVTSSHFMQVSDPVITQACIAVCIMGMPTSEHASDVQQSRKMHLLHCIHPDNTCAGTPCGHHSWPTASPWLHCSDSGHR